MRNSESGKLVERERIYKQLQRDMEDRHILYWRSNTGWGKTTTILQYFKYRKIPYISIDVTDEDFCANLKKAVSRGATHILMDDFHKLDTEQLEFFAKTLEQTPNHTKFYLLGRAWLPACLRRYEITNELVYYENSQLALNEKEAAKILEIYGIECSQRMISQIVKQTEGWMLYLIFMAKRGKNIKSLNNKVIELARLDLFDFFDDALWTYWDSDIRSFLLNVGHLSSFTEKEVCMVCGKSDVSEVLNKIQMVSSYLIRDDDMYYHFKRPMDLYLARKQKQSFDKATIKQRYENTALYFAIENDMPNALKYYSLAEDHQKMTEILIDNANSMAGDAYYYELEKYYLNIEPESIRQSPEMMAAMAMFHSLSMRTEKSDYYLNELMEFEHALPHSDPRKKIAQSKIAFLQFALPHKGSGNIIEKVQSLSKIRIQMQKASISGDMPSLMSGGMDFLEWSKNDRLMYQTMKMPMSLVFGKYADGIAEISLGESLFEKSRDGNFTESMMLINSGKASCEISGNLQFQFAADGLLTRMFVAGGRQATALNIMENYYERVLASGKRQLPLNTESLLIRLHMLMGENEPAELWLNESAPNEYEYFFILERYRYLTKVRIYILKKMYLEALALLDQLERYFLLYKRKYNFAEAKLLRAIVLFRTNNQMWEQELKAALEITYQYQLVRIIADMGAAILPLLTECLQNVKQETTGKKSLSVQKIKYLEIVLRNTAKQAEFYPLYLMDKGKMNYKLTETEKRVLGFLVQGLTNLEIADKLCIGVNTVKTHTGNIYRKLDVKNRVAAVRIAKKYELV